MNLTGKPQMPINLMTGLSGNMLCKRPPVVLFALCFVLLSVLSPVYAQNGVLKGKITDKKTGEPLTGATVAVVGTYKGAAADLDGNFLIKEIKHGDYTIKVSFVGYQEKEYNGIRIKKDEETVLNIQLNESNTTMTEVEVIGERNVVDLESGKSEVRIGASDIKEMNVKNVQDVAALQQGVSVTPDGLQIRGGRVYETNYLVEGINAQDPLAGTGFGVNVASGSVSDVTVVTGGSDAEYNGTSGIILTRIKEGGDKLQVAGNWQRDNFGFNQMKGTAWNTDIGELNIGGTIPGTKNKLKFFASGNCNLTDTYYRLRADQLYSSIQDNSKTWAPREDNNWAGTFKLSYKFSDRTRISITNQNSLAISQNTRALQITGFTQIMQPGLQWPFAQNLDNAATYTHKTNLTAINIQHVISRTWSSDFSLGRLFTNLRADANGRPFRDASVDHIYDPRSITTDPVQVFDPSQYNTNIQYPDYRFVLPGPGLYNNGGITTTWHDHYVQEFTVKYKFTHFSENKRHFVTLGQEHKEQLLQWVDVTSPWVGAPILISTDPVTGKGTYTKSSSIGSSADVWKVAPANGNFFVQDEIRYKGIIAVLGTSLQYWAPGAFADNAVADPTTAIDSITRSQYTKSSFKFLDGRRYKARLLPKLRVSFPISENHVMYFNYGQSMRLQHPRYLYAGLDPVYQNRSQLANLGNPNVNPDVAVSYELGIKSQITRDFGVTVTAFYKDYFDYAVTATKRVFNFATSTYTDRTVMINQDYSRVRGVEVGLNYRFSKVFRANFNGSFQVATGKSNSALDSRLQIIQTGSADLTKEHYLAFDRPYDLKANVIFTPDKSWTLFGVPLQGLRVFVLSTYKSGLRYTPEVAYDVNDLGRVLYKANTAQPFEKIGSDWFWTDVKITRDFKLGNGRTLLSASIQIDNIFNNQNAQIIDPVTGKAWTTGSPVDGQDRDPRYVGPNDTGTPPNNPARYMQPRHILYGISFSF